MELASPAPILGHIFGGRHGRRHPFDQVAEAPPHVAASTDRPCATRRVAVSNAAREALTFVACCVGVGVLGVLLYDILRAVRRR